MPRGLFYSVARYTTGTVFGRVSVNVFRFAWSDVSVHRCMRTLTITRKGGARRLCRTPSAACPFILSSCRLTNILSPPANPSSACATLRVCRVPCAVCRVPCAVHTFSVQSLKWLIWLVVMFSVPYILFMVVYVALVRIVISSYL